MDQKKSPKKNFKYFEIKENEKQQKQCLGISLACAEGNS